MIWKEKLQGNVEENRETSALKKGTSRNGFSLVRIEQREQREVSCNWRSKKKRKGKISEGHSWVHWILIDHSAFAWDGSSRCKLPISNHNKKGQWPSMRELGKLYVITLVGRFSSCCDCFKCTNIYTIRIKQFVLVKKWVIEGLIRRL